MARPLYDPPGGCGAARACEVCGVSSRHRFALCYCCAALVRQLRMPLVPVVVAAEFEVGDGMHRRLRGYKDAPAAEARDACADHLAEAFERWLDDHPATLRHRFGTGWDSVCPVPSTCRPGTPVGALVERIPALAPRRQDLLVRGAGAIGHLQADRQGFGVAPAFGPGRLAGGRVLVFDDTVITGARAQSAAAALRLAGACVVGVVAVGRTVRVPR